MKNVHLLPTDKPSRLYTNHGQLHLDSIFQQSNGHTINQNVYITSDLEIKEGDWYLVELFKITGESDGFHIEKCTKLDDVWCNNFDVISTRHKDNCKKIILTTDQDLIADGIQAIDDEFLEWFVKNPSCEFVEWDKNYNRGNLKYYYKIIIPQEESKTGYSKSETEFLGIEFTLKDGSKQFVPKQETLEEAAEKRIPTSPKVWDLTETRRSDFKAGAKSDAARDYWFKIFKEQFIVSSSGK
jgi:hypothetical protein